jgi:tetratricopeptide (TPR) repeat protein
LPPIPGWTARLAAGFLALIFLLCAGCADVDAFRLAGLPPEVAVGAKLLHEGKDAAAAAEFDKAIARDPHSAILYAAIAQDTCNQMNKPDLALRYAERGLQAVPNASKADRVRLLGAAANACAALGDYAKAVRYGRAALALLPDDPLVRNNLAYELAEQAASRQELQEALSLATSAVDAARADPDVKDEDMGVYLDTLGWVQYKLGAYDKAAPLLAQAADLAPTYAEILYHLASAYKALGRDAQARIALDRAEKALAGQDAPKPQLRAMMDDLRARLSPPAPAAAGSNPSPSTR